MKNYFFAADAVRKARLAEAGIGFCDLDLDGVAGIVVEEEQIGRALEVLGARKEMETPSSLEGIVLLALRFEAGGINIPRNNTILVPKVAPKVVVEDSDNMESWVEVKPILQKYADMLGVDVFVKNPHGERSEVRSEAGKLFVRFWSVPENLSKTKYNSFFGINLGGGRQDGVKPSGNGVPLVTPEGTVVAEIHGDTLFVLFDLMCSPSSNKSGAAASLMDKIMELYVLLQKSPEEREVIRKKMAEESHKKSREQYVAECSRRFEKTVQGTKEAAKKGREDIARLQQELARRIRETQGAERKLSQIESLRSDQTASYGREFDSLAAVPGVEDVQVSDGVVKVFTEHIYITPDGCADTFDIGKFRMEIYTSGANGGIRFFNLTRQGTGGDYNTNHPHVKKNGSPCLGNISEMVPTLIGEYEYSAVAQIGLQYLKSVNTGDSAGKGIFNCWPKVEKNKEE